MLCNSGWDGALYFGHPQTWEILCKTIYNDSLALNVMHVLPPLIIDHYAEHVPRVLVNIKRDDTVGVIEVS